MGPWQWRMRVLAKVGGLWGLEVQSREHGWGRCKCVCLHRDCNAWRHNPRSRGEGEVHFVVPHVVSWSWLLCHMGVMVVVFVPHGCHGRGLCTACGVMVAVVTPYGCCSHSLCTVCGVVVGCCATWVSWLPFLCCNTTCSTVVALC